MVGIQMNRTTLTSPIHSDFFQPDSDDTEVTFNSRSFQPALTTPRQLSITSSDPELNISQIPQPTLVPSYSDDNSRGSPLTASAPDPDVQRPAANWDISHRQLETDAADQNNKLAPDAQQTAHNDTLSKLQRFSFSPVKRLAELSL